VTPDAAPDVTANAPVAVKPAASVLLVRPGQRAPIEVYMIRRQQSMRFLGGFYAFPGGKVDAADAEPRLLARCRGLVADDVEAIFPGQEGMPALAYWVTAARELLEETGLFVASDPEGRPISTADPAVAAIVAGMRHALVAESARLADLLAAVDWYLDVAPLRYLSHFITPPSSPIRFSARFFLAPVPAGQAPRLFTEETSEGLWIEPARGVTRYEAGEMPMAEPAESGLRYLAGFPSLDALWQAHADGRHKFHGIQDRLVAAGVTIQRPRGAPRPVRE
jgi:8-oxo-dGTP pyrophosphatase MutT (NUDIX family)